MSAKKLPGYKEATDEIDKILQRIDENSEVDVDALADDVERAAELLQLCGEKLKAAEVRVQEVSQRLAVEQEHDSADEEE
ncbi:MAG: exodeoxyribonuclease VII small subunit [Planctomycetes bacterium]|jgi:exodeoxyribonuclease VII small subunit|nr:exodeoxyribonuclease VII small subunit [Planctomycetota bacterium]MBT6452965.1 exodeoxyribonuclease VII small subunit [Planctomycetota bacterium]MBT6541804.1 exodeoxyribonuclease VII small subunit [Planctomycetota bacterium]MBT6784584.1 exodeoxyribonuclease VII small subunit [Planctomycetota bacterium]MBT6968201.1 exodeoxyribonuclease VII small subunit [Planctomycetota bacterium]